MPVSNRAPRGNNSTTSHTDTEPSPLAARIASVEGVGKYLTTKTTCSCPDHQYRGRACKHMQALQMQEMVDVFEGCKACGGTGRDSRGNPCFPCAARAEATCR